ncbi:MAG: hypothetical protein OXM58_16490 [Rhodospirillaceae bacterium]|nr:hypothetical protein [Rhodospirillaceae bacterium]MDE0619966.1 hypothetical protein [Rhodospirillaceae bacterium]
MPLWKIEQITPYFEKEGSHTKHNPLGEKLVKDCLTNSEIGIIIFVEKEGSFNKEKLTAPTIIASTIAKHDVYREENPDMYSYEKAAEAIYDIYWRNLSWRGKLHRRAYKWSLPAIAGTLIIFLGEAVLKYLP